MTQSPENSGSGEKCRFSMPPVDIPPLARPETRPPGEPINWPPHKVVKSPDKTVEPAGPHDIVAVSVANESTQQTAKEMKPIRPTVWGLFKEQGIVTQAGIALGAVLLALGVMKGCASMTSGNEARQGAAPEVATRTFKSVLDLVVSRNPVYPVFTDAPLDLFLDPTSAEKISTEIVEVDLPCQAVKEPVILFLGHDGADTGHFQRVDPAELNPTAMHTLEQKRLEYEDRLRINSGVQRTPTRFEDGELNTVFTTLGRGICDIGNVYELKPQITAHEVFIAKEAGPVDQSGEGNNGAWGKVLIVLASFGVLAIIGKVRQLKNKLS